MPKYQVVLDDGRKFVVETEGGPPTEEEILSQLGESTAPAAPPSAPQEPPTWQERLAQRPITETVKGIGETALGAGESVVRPINLASQLALEKLGMGESADVLRQNEAAAQQFVKEHLGLPPKATFSQQAGHVLGNIMPLLPVVASAPVSTLTSLAGGALGEHLLAPVGEKVGEAVTEGGGELGKELGAQAGGFIGGAAPTAAKSATLAALAKAFPALEESLLSKGVGHYAKMVPEEGRPRTTRQNEALTERLKLISEELPVLRPLNPRGQLLETARTQTEGPAGAAISKTYRTGKPADIEGLTSRVEEAQRANTLVPEHEVPLTDELGDVVGTDWRSALPKSKAYQKQLQARTGELKKIGHHMETFKGGMDTGDILDIRQLSDEALNLAKKKAFNVKGAELMPAPRSHKVVREAAKDYLHELFPAEPGNPKSGGKYVDDVFSAWKAMEKAGGGHDAGTFLQRWVLARLFPGTLGTVMGAGAGAAKSAFWRSVIGRSEIALSHALRTGDKKLFQTVLRNAIVGELGNYEQPEQ